MAMPSIINLKRLAAVLLMLCFVLPLSRCDRKENPAAPPDQKGTAAQQVEKKAHDPALEDKYAYQNLSRDDPLSSALNIAAFFWPVIIYVLGRGNPTRRAQTVVNIFELLLCAGSGYMIWGITFFGDLRYGGYLAYSALASYSLLTLGQIFLLVRPQIRGRTFG